MRLVLTLVTFCFAGVGLAAETGDPPEPVLRESVQVTARRLADEAEDADRVPANVTIITREEIARLGVSDLAEVLALQVGAIVYDQTGNGVQTTFDMRGFTDGSGTRVYLDGAPLNDGTNNTLNLELVPLENLERVEITRGSSAALAGGGSEAGVINLVTRRGEGTDGAISLSQGTFDTTQYGGRVSHAAGIVDFSLSGTRRETDGFRTNADGDLRRLAANVGLDLGGDRRLGLTLVDSESDFGNPGALTASELADDPSGAPYNAPDYGDQRISLASLSYRGPISSRWSTAANLFARDRETDSLTTGRAAAAGYGGFALDSDASFLGSTVQLTGRRADGRASLTFGGEWLDGRTDSLGFSTPPADPGMIPPAPSSDTSAERTTTALYVQGTWSPARRWTTTAGARLDQDRVGLNETLPDPANDRSRRFSELSLRGGVTWTRSDALALYASYGEGFLPPTSEDLFAFPGFGSNPGLEPEDSRSYELGYRGRWSGGLRLDAGLFVIETRDEIVFDPSSPLGLFGASVNAGEARRQGAEISLRGRVHPAIDFFVDLTLTDARFTAGEHDGKDLPLVPGERLAVGFDADLPVGLALHADALRVGKQTLDGDDANTEPELAAYTVVNARVVWTAADVTGRRGGPRLFVEARNVFDETYATRGIFAFDFLSAMSDRFFTPAPGRRYLAGAEWDF